MLWIKCFIITFEIKENTRQQCEQITQKLADYFSKEQLTQLSDEVIQHIDENYSHMELVKIYQPGSFFGEISVLTNGKRTATIIAIQESQIAVLSKSKFDSLLGVAIANQDKQKINLLKEVVLAKLGPKTFFGGLELATDFQKRIQMAKVSVSTTIIYEFSQKQFLDRLKQNNTYPDFLNHIDQQIQCMKNRFNFIQENLQENQQQIKNQDLLVQKMKNDANFQASEIDKIELIKGKMSKRVDIYQQKLYNKLQQKETIRSLKYQNNQLKHYNNTDSYSSERDQNCFKNGNYVPRIKRQYNFQFKSYDIVQNKLKKIQQDGSDLPIYQQKKMLFQQLQKLIVLPQIQDKKDAKKLVQEIKQQTINLYHSQQLEKQQQQDNKIKQNCSQYFKESSQNFSVKSRFNGDFQFENNNQQQEKNNVDILSSYKSSSPPNSSLFRCKAYTQNKNLENECHQASKSQEHNEIRKRAKSSENQFLYPQQDEFQVEKTKTIEQLRNLSHHSQQNLKSALNSSNISQEDFQNGQYLLNFKDNFQGFQKYNKQNEKKANYYNFYLTQNDQRQQQETKSIVQLVQDIQKQKVMQNHLQKGRTKTYTYKNSNEIESLNKNNYNQRYLNKNELEQTNLNKSNSQHQNQQSQLDSNFSAISLNRNNLNKERSTKNLATININNSEHKKLMEKNELKGNRQFPFFVKNSPILKPVNSFPKIPNLNRNKNNNNNLFHLESPLDNI
ncbi:Cyclic nucleotide-binding protein [Pseudocohnilembus persalinus]|uniref:Cyclic nucleotide-binding protein n=1 Tax=Pseudocohnilembus persalinus TaxID=266149 RepID=A0A0V0R5B8_PSEPJ|nr:Cyclic nucleotide-binding protein [Pseudocohnilembus persalinus]|eukprot:KRX09552.1 Cyclic nucleotide-binding protein [Pseudocohnilembus persalinus]